jgi:EAL domain-containing protein (putative c-di-GMP-specific phosphodiesterase class I)
MIDIVLSAASTPVIGVGGGLDIGRGAIAGALIAGAAFMAGQAVFRRSATAVSGLFMLAAAAALQFGKLGFIPDASAGVLRMLECVFGAAALIFVSVAVKPVRHNALLGGLVFAGALSLIGIGIFNLLGRADMSQLVRMGTIGVGTVAVGIALLNVSRDSGARLVLPGALIALAAPAAGMALGSGFSLIPSAIFVVGVLTAGLVALIDGPAPRFRELGLHAEEAPRTAAPTLAPSAPAQDPARVSENQLAQVLDYSGVAVWDWNGEGAHQTESLAALLGAEMRGPISPGTLRSLIHKDDVVRLDARVFDTSKGDGAFDVILRLHDNRSVRMRGARAVTSAGDVERLVAFFEPAAEKRPVSIFGSGAAAKSAAAADRVAGLDPVAASFAEALDKGEIVTVFQPIVALETGKVAGYETLARWRGGKDGADRVNADELVRAAHACGKQDALAALVLKNATEFLCDRSHGDGRDIFVAMNVSIRQAQSPLFAEAVRALISEHKLKPKALVLELTETEALTDIEAATKAFRTLADHGAALALDDFGAGFSSLSHLKQFKFDYLKIDKSFINDLTSEKGSGKIARALASLAQDLGVAVIAEGVETREMGEIARGAGCAFGQGFAFGAPSPAAQFKSAPAAANGLSTKPAEPTAGIDDGHEASIEIIADPGHRKTAPKAALKAATKPDGKDKPKRNFWGKALR